MAKNFLGLRWCAIVMVIVACTSAAELSVDCSKVIGEIRPLHGGNCGPIQSGELLDLSAYFKELAIPYTRLHDCHWPNPDVVDIHAVFPNPSADPSLPASYDFSRTDDYIQAIVNSGVGIVYRLGESIEHTKKKYHVNPPADPQRWAAACLGIIRHYNDGWTGGFRHNIHYWEIWNEPENRPQMWTGSDEQFFQLYETAAKAITAKYPSLKVGGPSIGYGGRMVNGRFEPTEFLLKFLERCRDRSIPLDFFSWHLYTNDPSECLPRAKGLRDLLNRFGFTKTELHFNEWNYLPDNDWRPMLREGQGVARERFYDRIGNAEGAAFAACVLSNLQDSPIDVANYYTADNGGFGLFTANGVPRKNFYAFKAFRLLLETPRRLQTTGSRPAQFSICAGRNADGSQIGILLSNFKSDDKRIEIAVTSLPWDGPVLCQIFILDADHNLEKVREQRVTSKDLKIVHNLPAPSVLLIRLTK